MSKPVVVLSAILLTLSGVAAEAQTRVCADCVRSTMQTLAAPAMKGRGCATEDEHAAARVLADKLKTYGVRGGLPEGEYLQAVRFGVPTYAATPTLTAGSVHLTSGREILISSPASKAGSLVVITPDQPVRNVAGQIVLLDGPYETIRIATAIRDGAAVVITPPPPGLAGDWSELARRPPGRARIEGAPPPAPAPQNPVFVKPEAMTTLRALAGQSVTVAAALGPPEIRTTYNVIGVLPGRDETGETVLLSAHYDHLGVKNGVIYPGANDDASGTAAVLEFARIFASGAQPRRAIQFALFGCEEDGQIGSKQFVAHPLIPFERMVANLEFEMIGLPDPTRPKTLMLTGWERSNLGPMLKDKGADLGPDPYPEQNFFRRSDNYQLALKGVVAQTVSAWPLPPTYHRPTDDLAHVDLGFMTAAIESLVAPIDGLVNSDFRLEWRPGQKP